MRTTTIASLLSFLAPVACAQAAHGVAFQHQDWELACDNTRTCRAAGYQSDEDTHPVTVLLTRQAGPAQHVTAEVKLGRMTDAPEVTALPEKFQLALQIDAQSLGDVSFGEQAALMAMLEPTQTHALLAALRRDSQIVLRRNGAEWRLSSHGAAAVLLKMDEFQGRIGTVGALVRQGQRDEKLVKQPLPVPVIHSVPFAKAQASDAGFATRHAAALYQAVRSTPLGDNCPILADSQATPDQLEVQRLSAAKLLLSTPCWSGAYNFGSGYWVINATPPFRPQLVTTDGNGTSSGDGSIYSNSKGRGIGDCWSYAEWHWTGQRFVPTSRGTNGMCKLIEPGGAWEMPTLTTKQPPATRP